MTVIWVSHTTSKQSQTPKHSETNLDLVRGYCKNKNKNNKKIKIYKYNPPPPTEMWCILSDFFFTGIIFLFHIQIHITLWVFSL